MKILLRLLGTGGLIILAAAAGGCTADQVPDINARAQIQNLDSGVPDGFRRAERDYAWEFPRDYGPHLDFQTEWWYYTGNFEADHGGQFGYQLTFFRRGLVPPDQGISRESSWAADQVYMGHFALTDVESGTHAGFERFSRGGAGLAGAESMPFQVWLEDWSIVEEDSGGYRIRAEQDGFGIDLYLRDQKGVVFHGEGGCSRKGPDPGNASYYFSQTRLETEGAVLVGGERIPVEGLSWMDHEFSTSALSPGQVGWDWFSIQLDDGTDLMVFQIRRSDGTVDPYSSGTLIDPQGKKESLSREDFQIQTQDIWLSPESGAEYPAAWNVKIPGQDLTLEIQPLLADQEMDVSYIYWEGAVQVTGAYQGQQVSGLGYVELTGYAASMEGEF
jgi:predicted secreted hydrolase